MHSQYSIFDIFIVGVTILIAIILIINLTPKLPNRYKINEEYYIVETLLMERSDSYVFEQIRYGDLDKYLIKRSLDKMVPNNYFYLFEIPEYEFRVTNDEKLNSVYKCIQLERIYPVNEKFGSVHIIFGMWKKNEKMRVVNCGQ